VFCKRPSSGPCLDLPEFLPVSFPCPWPLHVFFSRYCPLTPSLRPAACLFNGEAYLLPPSFPPSLSPFACSTVSCATLPARPASPPTDLRFLSISLFKAPTPLERLPDHSSPVRYLSLGQFQYLSPGTFALLPCGPATSQHYDFYMGLLSLSPRRHLFFERSFPFTPLIQQEPASSLRSYSPRTQDGNFSKHPPPLPDTLK